MPKLNLIVLLFNILIFTSSAQAEEKVKIKTGRHYIKFLSATLEIPSYELSLIYSDLKFNLPKDGDVEEFYPSKDSIAKIADYMCNNIHEMMGGILGIDYLYERLLNRKPTPKEIEKQILVDGKFSLYANCFVLALHPEVILDKRGKK